MISHEAFDRLLAERIGAVIKREREKSGLTSHALAKQAGYHRATVMNAELGRCVPRTPVLFALFWEMDCAQAVWLEIAQIDAELRAQMKREVA